MWKAATEIMNKMKKKEIKKLLDDGTDEWRKKITTMGAVGVRGSQQELPVDLVFELCLRLPIHKLFQVMCVSNLWRSIISHPDFSKAYYSRNHSRVLVISLRELDNLCSHEQQFYHSLLGEQWVKSPLKIPYLGRYPEFTQVINGLVCAYSSNGLHHSFLCNIFTGEVMKLPDSGDIDDPHFAFASYYLAFDPVNKLYKLMRFISYHSKVLSCKILTLGSNCNSSWRKLTVPANIALTDYKSTSIVIHGVVFFCSLWEINAFNFTEENFHSVPLPMYDDEEKLFHYDLAQFRGRLTLLRNLGCRKMIIYTLKDNKSYSWTRGETILPRELQTWFSLVVPVGSLPTGEILLAPNDMSMEDTESRDPFTMLYSYDYEKDKFEKFVVGKFPQPINFRNSDSVISCVGQNVRSLDALIHGDGCFRNCSC